MIRKIRNRAAYIGATVVIVALALLAPILLVAGVPPLVGLLPPAVLMVVAWRFGLRPAVVATDRALLVRNPGHLYRLQWSEVVGFRVGGDMLLVDLRGGRRVSVMAVSRSLVSVLMRRPGRVGRVAGDLEAIRRDRAFDRSGPPAG